MIPEKKALFNLQVSSQFLSLSFSFLSFFFFFFLIYLFNAIISLENAEKMIGRPKRAFPNLTLNLLNFMNSIPNLSHLYFKNPNSSIYLTRNRIKQIRLTLNCTPKILFYKIEAQYTLYTKLDNILRGKERGKLTYIRKALVFFFFKKINNRDILVI